MALVAFLERLVMTVLEEAITNDQFLACTSVSIVTAWRAKAFWDWTTFLVFQTRQGCTNSRELAFSTGKGKNNKDKTLVMIRQLVLFITDTHVLLGLGPMVLPVANDLLLITSAKRMELNRNLTHK